MSKILANQIANYGDDAPIEIKEGLNIPAGKPIQAAGSAGSAGQVLSTTGTTIQWVAPFDGDYNSLTNTPAIPAAQVNSDWNATSGVSRILNKPVVPPQPSVTTNAAGTAALSYNSVNGQFTFTPPDLSEYATEAWVGSQSYLTAEADTLATVTGRGSTTTNNIQVGNLTANGLSASNDVLTLGDASNTFTIRFSQASGTSPQIRNNFGESGIGIYGAYNFGSTHAEDIHLGTSGVRSRFKHLDPQTDLSFDLGSSTKRWDNIYAGKLYYSNNFATTGDLPNATTYHGMFAHVHAEGHGYFAHADAWTQLLDTGSSIGDLADVNLAVAPQSGQVLAYDGSNWVATAAGGGGGGIALSDLSVTTNAAGSAALTYNNVSGVFTYTPPDLSGYLTSFTETDPVFSISPAASISTVQINNWDTAYGWGDHSAAGYLTAYTETGTLDDVTSRGASTTNSVSLGGIQLGTLTQLANSFGNTNTLKFGGDMTIFHMQDGTFGTSNRIIVDEYNLIIGTKGETPDNYYTNLIEVHVGNDLGSTSNTADVRLGFGNVGTRLQTTAAGVTITGALTAGGLTYPTSNGTSGQVLTSDGAGNVVWGAAATGNTQVTISDTLPSGTPSAGDLWWESDTGRLKIYYQDTDSSQWVDTNPPLADATSIGGQGTVAMRASIIPDTNAAYDIGSAEYKIRDLYLDSGSIHTPSGNNLSFYDGNLTWGGDDVIMLQDLKDMMATATSFEDFKNAIMGL